MNQLKRLVAGVSISLCIATSSLAQQDDAVHSTSVMKMIDSNGNATVTVVSDGVPQVFSVAPDGTLISNDGSQPVAIAQSIPNGKGGQPGGPMIGGPKTFTLSGAPGGADLPAAAQQAIEQARQRAADALKDALGCSDAEWAVLGPKIQLIQTLQGAAMPGSATAALKNGIIATATVPQSVSELRGRLQEFTKLVNNKDAADGQVTQALASVRQARNKVKSELAEARKELTELVTPRQEAILYQKGVLAE